jgi:chromate transporter
MHVPLGIVVREWGRIGLIGFGGPPAHVALLRELCVERRGWIDDREFEDANAACGLLPGPASTQLAIYCAHRVGGVAGGILGGIAFIVPGLLMIIVLAATALSGGAPDWLMAAGAGAGAAVVPVVAQAGFGLGRTSLRLSGVAQRLRAVAYLAIGATAVLVTGWGVVLALLACGLVELAVRRARRGGAVALHAWPILFAAASQLAPLSLTAFKVGALSYGGGFVIIPLMQSDAVGQHHWMTDGQFLDAVALGQVTPGPVVQTVAVVGYAAAGLLGGLLAALMAFSPSFLFVVIGADRFRALLRDARVRAFIDGAAPAALGAILGSAIPLARALSEPWQWLILAAAAAALLVLRRGVVATLVAAGAAGVAAALAGATLPA